MTEQKFRFEMRRAQIMERRENADPMEAEYWRGYQRGLRRLYHGGNFGTAEEHTLWLSLAERHDERSKQRGRGYRDGLAYEETFGKLGRPLKYDTPLTERLDLGLTASMRAALPADNGATADWIREAIQEKLDGNKPLQV